MISTKKLIRAKFRASVFSRDKYTCRMCGYKPGDIFLLDAHHITDRTLMDNGGYVMENGVSLCGKCHIKAEAFHQTGESVIGFSPEDLYEKINSSHEKAVKASKKLK